MGVAEAEVGRAEDADITTITYPPRAGIPAVHISGEARVSGNSVIAGGDVIINNYTVSPNGESIDGKLKQSRLEIADWFAPNVNVHAIQQQNYEKWTDGTLSWFTDSPDYLGWKGGRHRILWGTGIPGAGKTILAARTIRDLQKLQETSSKRICVVFAYCRYSERLTVKDILESLVRQFIESDPSLADLVEPLCSMHQRKKTRPTQKELLDLLRQLESRFDTVFYVIDGLDEALVDTQFDLIQAIKILRGQFALTSRPLKRLEAGLPNPMFYLVTANDSDIVLLIQKKVERNPGFKSLLEQHSYLGELVRRILDKSKGMFLHAALQIEVVQHSVSIVALQRTLDNFPTKLRDIYSQALERISDQEKENADLAKHVLLWLVFGREALSYRELQYALSLTLPGYPAGIDKDTLLSLCCGLVTVEAKSDLVRLVHFTAQDALAPLVKEHIPDPHGVLFKAAAGRLVDCGFVDNSAGLKTGFDLHTALKHQPFCKYSYDHWGYHARKAMANPSSVDAVVDFVRQCKSFPVEYSWHLTLLSPLHIVARHGLCGILDEILVKAAGGSVTLRTCGAKELTPLMIASRHGHVEVIDGLLRYTRSSALRSVLSGEGRPGRHLFFRQLNLRDCVGMTALMHASSEGHEGVVQRLLAHKDTQINLTDSGGRTAFMHASGAGREGVVRLLLAHKDTQVHLTDDHGWTAFMLASSEGREGVVRLLLAHKDTQVNLTDDHGWTAFMLASSEGREGVVRLLLAHKDTQVNLTDNGGRTAFMQASGAGREGVVRLLLAHKDTQVHLTDDHGWTAFMLASSEGREGVVRLLLAHKDTQVNLTDIDGQTALMLALRNGHEGTIRLLLAHKDTQVNLTNNNGWTALMLASNNGHECAVQLLLAHQDAQVNLTDNYGWTALMHALRRGPDLLEYPFYMGPEPSQLGVLKLLVDRKVDANAVDKHGDTALIFAARDGRREAVSLLLQHTGIDVYHSNNKGETALSIARKRYVRRKGSDYKAIVQLLSEYERRPS
ncbi:ankyrin repeat domain-containing protein 50 [Coprinopsis cinerea okayama7|uniref:Ankyrin repeat domain-containing protein 50 n=1 Tax=Coprinopsis cinerea (strain Okayama-7 / 130 / ATCC MYA-4618 / FGSC 9003) TaxID=240176 RepID=A8NQ38_COPC7|nr:ankyrin repeat domain-containing protein 50 [Coprinopsis cinerea okayama7\|eukprot:XP_001835474.2 ankyrin repeat domain-containing protein 50 [Coprinopsis cinerea okayama7\